MEKIELLENANFLVKGAVLEIGKNVKENDAKNLIKLGFAKMVGKGNEPKIEDVIKELSKKLDLPNKQMQEIEKSAKGDKVKILAALKKLEKK